MVPAYATSPYQQDTLSLQTTLQRIDESNLDDETKQAWREYLTGGAEGISFPALLVAQDVSEDAKARLYRLNTDIIRLYSEGKYEAAIETNTSEFAEVIALIRDGDRQEQRSQLRIDQLDDQCTYLLNDIWALRKQLEAANRYNRSLMRSIGAQEDKIARLSDNKVTPTTWTDEIGPSEDGPSLTGKYIGCSLDQKATDIHYPMPLSEDETLTFDSLVAFTKLQQQSRIQINNARESAFLKARNDQRAALNALRNAALNQERLSTMLEEVMSMNQQIIDDLELGGYKNVFPTLIETPQLPRLDRAVENAETSEQKSLNQPSPAAKQYLRGTFPGPKQARQNVKALLVNWRADPVPLPGSEEEWTSPTYPPSETERDRDAYATLSLAYLAGRLSTDSNLRTLMQYASFFENPYTATSILERELEIGRLTAELDTLTFQAQLLTQAREHARAISVLSRAAEIDPGGGTSYKLGQVLMAYERHEAAETALTNALAKGLEMEEDTGAAWQLLGASIFAQAGPDDRVTWGRARSAFVEAQKFESSSSLAKIWVNYIDNIEATHLRNLGGLYVDQGRYAEAEPLLSQALELYERALGHPGTLQTVSDYFFLMAAAHEQAVPLDGSGDQLALRLLQQNLADLAGQLSAGVAPARLRDPTSAEAQARNMVDAFERARFVGVPGSDIQELREPVYELIQRFSASGTSKALAAATQRLAITDERQRKLLDDREQLTAEYNDKVASLEALRKEELRNAAAEATIQEDLVEIERQIDTIDTAFVAEDAGSAELLGIAQGDTGALTVTSREASGSLLDDGEAMLVYSSVGRRYLAFVLRQDLATVVSLDVTRGDVAKRVDKLRDGLQLPFRMVDGVKVPSSDPDDLPDFDLGAAAELYSVLIGPLEPHLKDITKLVIVADGPLQSLPFSVLVQEVADQSLPRLERYRQSTFLVDRFAVNVQPSISAIQTLRADTPRSGGDRPLLGFADPVLSPDQADAGDRVRTSQNEVENKAVIIPMSGSVDTESLEQLPPLPQTADLLQTIGNALGANPRDLYLGEDAQEVDLRFLAEQDRLKRYRMIIFASHALVSNEIEAIDLIEPAIVMSLPPAPPGEERPWENDGLLRASDIIRMNMDPDMVVLAACNTAAPDGTPGAEPLSGLAKAFMYKGARSLLVSHWQADAPSTANLIPAMVRYADEEDDFVRGLARAKREMRKNATQPENLHWSHPAIWGPFTLVGEPG